MACNVEDIDPLVDVRLFKSYGKQHTTTTVPTLERALRESTGRVWYDYATHVQRLLDGNGFPHASRRWQNVIIYAKKISGGDSARERRYLQIYFFEEHLGRGMPEEQCTPAALQIASADPSMPLPHMAPTVQADVNALEEKLAMMGHWANHGQMQAQYARPMPWQMQQQYQPAMAMQFQGAGAPQTYPPMMGGGYGMPSPPPQLMMGGSSGYGPPETHDQPAFEELPGEPAEQMPCRFCGGAKHVQSKCTLYIQARLAQSKANAEKVATKRQVAADKKLAAELAAAAAAAATNAAP
jgi:hypothetical protein